MLSESKSVFHNVWKIISLYISHTSLSSPWNFNSSILFSFPFHIFHLFSVCSILQIYILTWYLNIQRLHERRNRVSLLYSVLCLGPKTAFFFFFFSGPHTWHVEIPRWGVESELQLPAYATATATPDPSCVWDLHCSSRQHRILNQLREARDRTQILVDTSWVSYCWATMGTPQIALGWMN